MSLLSPEMLEQALENLPGDRITIDYIHSRIQKTEFIILPGTTTTICNIILDNGYSVRGESACVDVANFNTDIGETYAHQDAIKKLWPLFGFLLAEKLSLRVGG